MELDCGSFTLKPLTPDDKESMAKHANNKSIWRNVRNHFPYPYTIDDAASFIRYSLQQNTKTDLALKVQNECIGVIGITILQDVYKKSADFGYWLAEPFWGKGIMTLAATRAIPYFFEHFDIVRLQSGVFEWNIPSMRVLEKAGFVKECIAIKAVYKDGILANEHRYSYIKHDLINNIKGNEQ